MPLDTAHTAQVGVAAQQVLAAARQSGATAPGHLPTATCAPPTPDLTTPATKCELHWHLARAGQRSAASTMPRTGQDGRPGHVSLVSSVAGFAPAHSPAFPAPPRRPHCQPGLRRPPHPHAPSAGVSVVKPGFVATLPICATTSPCSAAHSRPKRLQPRAAGKTASSTSTSQALHPLDEMAAVAAVPVVLSAVRRFTGL